MEYTKQYSANELYDMFANDADVEALRTRPVTAIIADLKDLAPDMTDAELVALSIKTTHFRRVTTESIQSTDID